MACKCCKESFYERREMWSSEDYDEYTSAEIDPMSKELEVSYGDSIDVFIPIKYCPMCGKKL